MYLDLPVSTKQLFSVLNYRKRNGKEDAQYFVAADLPSFANKSGLMLGTKFQAFFPQLGQPLYAPLVQVHRFPTVLLHECKNNIPLLPHKLVKQSLFILQTSRKSDATNFCASSSPFRLR